MSGELKNVLVGYDAFERDEPLPALAIALAREHGARLHVVHVAPRAPRSGWHLGGTSAADLHADMLRTRRRELEQRLARAAGDAIDTRASVRTGTPHLELVRAALEVDADLLVVGDRGLEAEPRGFGTVTMKLFRFSPCPVLAKRNLQRRQHDRVVAAVDLESADDPSLNRAIVAAAAMLTRQGTRQLVIYHAWSFWGESLLSGHARLSPEEVQGLVAEARQRREQEMSRLVARARLEGVEARGVLEKGEVRELLPAFARREGADVVVMGTVGRAGLGGVLMGNTAERLLNRLVASVLAVKPPGFVSPVDPHGD